MKKFSRPSFVLMLAGIAFLSSAAGLRLAGGPSSDPSRSASRRSHQLIPAAFAAAMPNYVGYDSTDVCAENSFPTRNNNLKTKRTCPGFPGAGCYDCEPTANNPAITSGFNSGAGAGAFMPSGGTNGSCGGYKLFQGVCRSNFGNYYCEGSVDQEMQCSGEYPTYINQGTLVALEDDQDERDDPSPGNSSTPIVIR